MPSCFVIMPFRPELRYLYSTIRRFLEESYPGIEVERGDDAVPTKPILEKIRGMIAGADVVLADCTGKNPNVFYELGMAHALDKPVVLVTADPVEAAPTDVRAFEFISYATEPDQFLERLRLAFDAVLGDPYEKLHEPALVLFEEFLSARKLDLQPVTKAVFLAAARRPGRRHPAKEGREQAEALIRLLLDEPRIETLIELKEWLDVRFA